MARLRIEIVGKLATLLDEIQTCQREFVMHALAPLVNEADQALRTDAMRYRFDQAREKTDISKGDFQFRDFWARAATEADDADGPRSA